MARAGDPKIMMLDEPAAGLSRGERVALTDLLLRLDRDVTLLLIEHDMDVALRVAERVTMMHDGRVIVEGTPDEIKANQPCTTCTWERCEPWRVSRCSPSRASTRWYGRAQVLHDVELRDGHRVGGRHRPQRHGQDEPLPGADGADAASARAPSASPARS